MDKDKRGRHVLAFDFKMTFWRWYACFKQHKRFEPLRNRNAQGGASEINLKIVTILTVSLPK